MTTHLFDTTDNQKFWEGNQATYQAETNSPPLVFLVGEFVGKKILDAGSGEGSLMREAKRRFPEAEVTGVDLAPKHPDVEQGDLTALRYEDGAFDTVFCLEVIEHVSPEITSSILTELNRVIAPGGHLILTTPYAENLEESLIACPSCECTFHRWGHQQRFLEQDFEKLAASHSFEPITIMPVRYSRVKRLRMFGSRFLRTKFIQDRMRKAKGKRSLVMIARKAR